MYAYIICNLSIYFRNFNIFLLCFIQTIFSNISVTLQFIFYRKSKCKQSIFNQIKMDISSTFLEEFMNHRKYNKRQNLYKIKGECPHFHTKGGEGGS